MSRLRLQISRQEELNATLNNKCASLLKLLEDRSMSSNGNTVLADYHRIESEAATLRKEKVGHVCKWKYIYIANEH